MRSRPNNKFSGPGTYGFVAGLIRRTMKRLLTNADTGLLSRSAFTPSPPPPLRKSKACLKLLTMDWNACRRHGASQILASRLCSQGAGTAFAGGGRRADKGWVQTLRKGQKECPAVIKQHLRSCVLSGCLRDKIGLHSSVLLQGAMTEHEVCCREEAQHRTDGPGRSTLGMHERVIVLRCLSDYITVQSTHRRSTPTCSCPTFRKRGWGYTIWVTPCLHNVSITSASCALRLISRPLLQPQP